MFIVCAILQKQFYILVIALFIFYLSSHSALCPLSVDYYHRIKGRTSIYSNEEPPCSETELCCIIMCFCIDVHCSPMNNVASHFTISQHAFCLRQKIILWEKWLNHMLIQLLCDLRAFSLSISSQLYFKCIQTMQYVTHEFTNFERKKGSATNETLGYSTSVPSIRGALGKFRFSLHSPVMSVMKYNGFLLLWS